VYGVRYTEPYNLIGVGTRGGLAPPVPHSVCKSHSQCKSLRVQVTQCTKFTL